MDLTFEEFIDQLRAKKSVPHPALDIGGARYETWIKYFLSGGFLDRIGFAPARPVVIRLRGGLSFTIRIEGSGLAPSFVKRYNIEGHTCNFVWEVATKLFRQRCVDFYSAIAMVQALLPWTDELSFLISTEKSTFQQHYAAGRPGGSGVWRARKKLDPALLLCVTIEPGHFSEDAIEIETLYRELSGLPVSIEA